MAKSLAQIQLQINRLQQQAEALRAKEVAGVVEKIKVAIAHYGLTAADLGVSGEAASMPAAPAARSATPRPRRATAKNKAPLPVKFRDEAGNTWVGQGKRPKWFVEAIAAGKTADDLRVMTEG